MAGYESTGLRRPSECAPLVRQSSATGKLRPTGAISSGTQHTNNSSSSDPLVKPGPFITTTPESRHFVASDPPPSSLATNSKSPVISPEPSSSTVPPEDLKKEHYRPRAAPLNALSRVVQTDGPPRLFPRETSKPHSAAQKSENSPPLFFSPFLTNINRTISSEGPSRPIFSSPHENPSKNPLSTTQKRESYSPPSSFPPPLPKTEAPLQAPAKLRTSATSIPTTSQQESPNSLSPGHASPESPKLLQESSSVLTASGQSTLPSSPLAYSSGKTSHIKPVLVKSFTQPSTLSESSDQKVSLPMTLPDKREAQQFMLNMQAGTQTQKVAPSPRTEDGLPKPAFIERSDTPRARGIEELCSYAFEGNDKDFFSLYRELPKYAINMKDSKDVTPLASAAAGQRTKILVEILNLSYVDINGTSGPDQETALHVCTYKNYEECVAALLLCGANQHQKSRLNVTPYQIAFYHKGNMWEIYKAFDKQATAEDRKKLFESFLDTKEWSEIRRLSAISFYIRADFEQSYPEHSSPSFPIAQSVCAGPTNSTVIELVECLSGWKTGGDSQALEKIDKLVASLTKEIVNLSGNEKCHTPLFAAARTGLNNVVLAILRIPGVNPNVVTLAGHTALHVASFEGHTSIIALLLAAGAELKFNHYNWHPQQIAAKGALHVFKTFQDNGLPAIIRDYPKCKEIYQFENLSLTQKQREYEALLRTSNTFQERTPFPLRTNTMQAVATTRARKLQVARFAVGCRIVVHVKIKKLISAFLEVKQDLGSSVEKEIYRDMNVDSFLERIITKRPLTFFGLTDITVLRDNTNVDGIFWSSTGTDNERKIKMADYLTYDEMAISSLIGASCPTYFINDGRRNNAGVPDPSPYYPCPGVYVGLVGARFEKRNRMESTYLLIQEREDPTPEEEALAKIWSDFYQRWWPSYAQLKEFTEEDQKLFPRVKAPFSPLAEVYLNVGAYQKRMEFTIETFLVDANDRGKATGKEVFCHIVGLGLGAWQVSEMQGDWIYEVFETTFKSYNFPYIKNLDFSWFKRGNILKSEEPAIWRYGNNCTKVTFSRRNPANPLVGEDADKLLVAMYAWDSNSYPGNEYWDGHFTESGDPAAICCSLLQELQNPEINFHLLNNVFWADPSKTEESENNRSFNFLNPTVI